MNWTDSMKSEEKHLIILAGEVQAELTCSEANAWREFIIDTPEMKELTLARVSLDQVRHSPFYEVPGDRTLAETTRFLEAEKAVAAKAMVWLSMLPRVRSEQDRVKKLILFAESVLYEIDKVRRNPAYDADAPADKCATDAFSSINSLYQSFFGAK